MAIEILSIFSITYPPGFETSDVALIWLSDRISSFPVYPYCPSNSKKTLSPSIKPCSPVKWTDVFVSE